MSSNPFGAQLRSLIDPAMVAPVSPALQVPVGAPPAPQKMGRGQLIAGILGDALAGAMGRPGAFAAQQQQRRAQEQERADWGLKRQADRDDFEWQQGVKARYDKPDVSPMERDLNFWRSLDDAGRTDYRALQAVKPQFVPDGLGGGQWVQPPAPSARAPAGPPPGVSFVPLPDAGGPTPKASGTFRPR